jgi:hypothetical protein
MLNTKFRKAYLLLSPQNTPLIFIEVLVWIVSIGGIAFLWNKWLIPGPYGPYRWIGMDFVPYWVGVRQMIHGMNPYDTATTLKIQQAVYGGPAINVDPMMFVYPAYMFILVAPFGLLPLNWAVALFAGTLTWGLINLILVLSFQWSKKFSRRIILGIVLVMGSLPFFVISISKGQIGYFGMGALFIAWRLWDRKPFWSGAVLGLAILKPTAIIIPVTGYLFWSLLKKNFIPIYGFLFTITILTAGSLFAIGNWIPSYLDVLKTGGGAPVIWSLQALFFPWNIIYIMLFAVLLIYAVKISIYKSDHNLWMSAFILAGIAFFPMRWIYDLFLGILIPSQEKNLSTLSMLGISLAVISPWSLILLPETSRWNFAAIAIPLAWALSLIIIIRDHNRISAQ